jgi:hypothetical protein
MLILVTGADIEPRKVREIEYTLCLYKVFHYKVPVVGVLSEWSTQPTAFDRFPFQTCLRIPAGELQGWKSRREYVSMHRLMQQVDVQDNEFIVKVSGRYLILDDTFVATVQRHETGSADAVVMYAPDSSKERVCTFLFAVRAKTFREFLNSNIVGEYESIEQVLCTFLKQKTVVSVDSLGILTNINGEGFAKY